MTERSNKLKHYFLKDINFVIRLLITSDIVLAGAASLLAPVFALFIEDFIQGGNATVAGIAAAIFLFTKSALQIPIATFIDRVRGEKDDFNLLLYGSIVMSIIPLAYLIIDTPWQLYLVQFVLGVFTALTFPSYMAIFTRHIDSKKEGTEWGVYFTLTDLSSAGLSALGGFFATIFGFSILIITMVVISAFGALLLVPIRPFLKLKASK